jgi:hypothetical protein
MTPISLIRPIPKLTRVAVAIAAAALLVAPCKAQTDEPRQLVHSVGAGTSKYFALVIGNNDYRNIKKLETAVIDAKSVDELLRQTYGFQSKLLLNATRNQILAALNDYRKALDPDASLLIYYAGHGHFDKRSPNGVLDTGRRRKGQRRDVD